MAQPLIGATAPELARVDTPAARLVAAALAGGLGLIMLFGVALSPIDIVHNAAHDTRHTISVPCH
jgi:cobalt transporter subunit CbtB